MMNPHKIRLSVICPVFNEEKYIDHCLMDGILQQDFPQSEMEVFFVDGQSTDASREILQSYANQYPFIHILDNPRRIVPVAMNLALEKAQGEVIIRLDVHATYAPNYFSTLVRRLEELHAANVGCPVTTDVLRKTPLSLAIREVLSNRFGVGNSLFRLGVEEVREVDTVPFGCFPRSVFERYGKYDERLVRNQDIELNKRIIRGGGKIYLVPDTSCTYYAREDFASLAKNNYQNGKWNLLTVFYTGELRSLSLRHFMPLLFLLSWTLPLLLGWLFPPLFILSILSLGLYFVIISVESLKISFRKRLNFVYLQFSFFILHSSYGVGSMVGLLSFPFVK